jgi:glucose 1-dehydrogenase
VKAVAVTPARREIAVVDRPEPEGPAPGEVLLRTLEVGVCGTDREIADFEYGTPPPGERQLVIGHESLAEVLETGTDVEGLEPGQLVVSMVRRPCPDAACRPCRLGHQDFCVTGDFVERGIKEAHGFMVERFTDEPRFLFAVPGDLRDVAVLVEPLTIAEKALAELWLVQQRLPWVDPSASPERRGEGHTALVLGSGAVGRLGAMALRAAGFETFVYAREPAPNAKASAVEAYGATYLSAAEVQPEDLGERAGGSIDVVYEAAGASQLAFDVLGQLGPNAVFVFTGVPGRKGAITFDADAVMRRLVLGNQVALGTVNAGRDAYERAIADLARFRDRWPGALPGLITGRHPVDAAPDLLRDRPPGIKHSVVLAP